jgi:20S proteasome subunit alpha 1
VKTSGLTSIGVRGDDCVVFITQKRVADKLVDASSVTHLFKLTQSIGCVMTGMLPDAKATVSKTRQAAAAFEFDNGYPIPAHYLARKVADEAQIYTQAAYKRSSAAVMILGA